MFTDPEFRARHAQNIKQHLVICYHYVSSLGRWVGSWWVSIFLCWQDQLHIRESQVNRESFARFAFASSVIQNSSLVCGNKRLHPNPMHPVTLRRVRDWSQLRWCVWRFCSILLYCCSRSTFDYGDPGAPFAKIEWPSIRDLGSPIHSSWRWAKVSFGFSVHVVYLWTSPLIRVHTPSHGVP